MQREGISQNSRSSYHPLNRRRSRAQSILMSPPEHNKGIKLNFFARAKAGSLYGDLLSPPFRSTQKTLSPSLRMTSNQSLLVLGLAADPIEPSFCCMGVVSCVVCRCSVSARPILFIHTSIEDKNTCFGIRPHQAVKIVMHYYVDAQTGMRALANLFQQSLNKCLYPPTSDRRRPRSQICVSVRGRPLSGA